MSFSVSILISSSNFTFLFICCFSFNINGETVHSGLKIFPDYSLSDVAPALEGDRLANLQKKFKNTKIIIIDEKSMLSAVRFKQIDIRCRELNPEGKHLVLGGLSVIIVGDQVSFTNESKGQNKND